MLTAEATDHLVAALREALTNAAKHAHAKRVDVVVQIDSGDVLLIVNDGAATIGSPTIAGAKVQATVEGEIKGPKLISFRYKAKERQRSKRGHRQHYTRLLINTIEG